MMEGKGGMTMQKELSLQVRGMSCRGCEKIIGDELKKIPGLYRLETSYRDGRVKIIMEPGVPLPADLASRLQKIGYPPKAATRQAWANRVLGVMVAGMGLLVLDRAFGIWELLGRLPLAEADMNHGMLFMVGFITSFHCIAMCGGISLTQTLRTSRKKGQIRPALLYNGGRVLSYTLIGAAIGLAGTSLSFSRQSQGLIQMVAGFFMVLMGLNMLGAFPWIRRFSFRIPKHIQKRVPKIGGTGGPFLVGLLNGLMPCGPLQAMQLMALGAGSALAGALAMLAFSLGTVPVMLAFGAIAAILSQRTAKKVAASGAVLIIILGFSMASRGVNLAGLQLMTPARHWENATPAQLVDGIQQVKTILEKGSYGSIVVQANTPVIWNIYADGDQITGCNSRLIISGTQDIQLVPGDNLISFFPEEEGTLTFSCWMGMIKGTIHILPVD